MGWRMAARGLGWAGGLAWAGWAGAAGAAPTAYDADCQPVAPDGASAEVWRKALAEVQPKGGWQGWVVREAPEVLARLQGVWRRSDKVITKILVGDEEQVAGPSGRYVAKLRAFELVRGPERAYAVAWRLAGRQGAYRLSLSADQLHEYPGPVGTPAAKPAGRFERIGPAPGEACDQRFALERDVRAARAREAFLQVWPALRAGGDEARAALVAFLGAHRGAVRVGARAEVVVFPEVQVAGALLATLGDEDAPSDVVAPPPPPKPPAPIEWLTVAGGRFTPGTARGAKHERPGRPVKLADFALSQTEVTNAQYQRCVAAQHCTPPRWEACAEGRRTPEQPAPPRRAVAEGDPLRHPDRPVVCVSFAQAARFAEFAEARLPSEAEWAFAARGRGAFEAGPWDRGPASCWRAVMHPAGGALGCGEAAPAPPCSKAAGRTAEGICDLVGNVGEWVSDHFGPYSGLPKDGSPRAQPASPGELRAFPWAKGARGVRGGGWRDDERGARATARHPTDPEEASDDVGIRLARSVAPPGK